MELRGRIQAAVAVATIAVTPLALATGAEAHPGSGHDAKAQGHHAKAPPSQSSSHGKAYGKLCQSESKQHVAGEKGTPFSDCVKAMAKLHNGSTHNPAKACAGLSKKHVAGQKGTPYSQCVSAGAKLRKGTK
jgi:hypothetical protein